MAKRKMWLAPWINVSLLKCFVLILIPKWLVTKVKIGTVNKKKHCIQNIKIKQHMLSWFWSSCLSLFFYSYYVWLFYFRGLLMKKPWRSGRITSRQLYSHSTRSLYCFIRVICNGYSITPDDDILICLEESSPSVSATAIRESQLNLSWVKCRLMFKGTEFLVMLVSI